MSEASNELSQEQQILARVAPDFVEVGVEKQITQILAEDAAVAAVKSEAVRKKRKRDLLTCKSCGNDRENEFVEDARGGSVTCRRCGTVAIANKVRDAQWVRSFEDDGVNPSQHGPPPDHRFSSAHNMRTSIAGDVVPGPGEGTKKAARDLSNAAVWVEMNHSNLMSEEKKGLTREGYKDKRKVVAFMEIDDVGTALNLPEYVKERAKTLFAQFRDAKEQVVSESAVVAGCVVAALRERASGVAVKANEPKIKQQQKQRQTTAKHKQTADEKLHPFQCLKCLERFNSKQDVRFHECSAAEVND